MATSVPRARPDASAGEVRDSIIGRRFAEAGHVYLVDADGMFVAQVPMENLLGASASQRMSEISGPDPIRVGPDDAAEAVALLAVKRQEADVAVVDAQGRLKGVVAMPKLLAILHHEHVEDYLRAAGIEASHPPPEQPYHVWRAYRARMRWLIVGLIGGMGAAFVVRYFEQEILAEVSLAVFLPLVVYLADAVGTQTEAIVVRSLALGGRGFRSQFVEEGTAGILIGVSLGALAVLVLGVIGDSPDVALVVGTSILAASIVATLLATSICWGAALIGTDPALASGPVATVIQDIVSVATYLFVASILL